MARRRFVRDVIGVFNSNVFSIIAGLLASIILARVLGPDKYGTFTALVIIPMIVVSLTHLGIRGSAIFHVGKGHYDRNELASTVVLLLIIASVLGMLISAIVYWVYDEPNFSLLMISLVLLVIPGRLAIIYFGGVFLGNDEINRANQLNWITNAINLLLIAILVWAVSLEIIGAIIAFMLSGLAVAVYGFLMLRKSFEIKLRVHKQIIKSMLKLGILFSVSFFILQLNYRIDILLLEKMKDATEVGLYSLGASIAEQLWQLPLAIGIVVFSRAAGASDKKELLDNTVVLMRLSLLFSILASAVIYIIVPYLVPLIFGDEYIPSIRIIQIILPGIIMVVVFRILSGHLAGLGRPEITLYIFLPALVVNILLNLLWIPEYGGRGAAWATNVSYTIGSVGYLFLYARIVKRPIKDVILFRKTDFQQVRQLIKSLRKKSVA